ncbi:MAG: ABC transporter substrate-binding protein [Candidatus Aminicenantes bacterium]|nr:MAG: ABC transporter substrate-binding protein [Candidatus Aminicenantes bacterium]
MLKTQLNQRRFFLWSVLLIVVCPILFPVFLPAADSPAHSPQTPVRVIVVVESLAASHYNDAVNGFKETLKKENISAHLKRIECDPKNESKKEDMIKEIQSQQPALILTMGTTATKFISDKINDLPIVFTMIMDPWGTDIAARNIVGTSLDIPAQLHLETLKTVVPKCKRIGMIYNPPENETIARKAKQAANALGLILNAYPVNSEKEIPKIKDLNIDLLWIIPDTVVCRPAILKRILFSCLKNKVAVMGFSRQYARAGALLAVTCDYEDIGRQSGETAVKLLKGENYSHLKITVPRKVKFYLNKTVAHRLGISIPGEIIQKASEVFGQ